jgi:hypothetical protein
MLKDDTQLQQKSSALPQCSRSVFWTFYLATALEVFQKFIKTCTYLLQALQNV